jgi:hypothetical protein
MNRRTGRRISCTEGAARLPPQVSGAPNGGTRGASSHHAGSYVGGFLPAAARAFVASGMSYAIRETPRTIPVAPAAAAGS